LKNLQNSHNDMLKLVAAHERQSALDTPNILELTRLRLEMMKVHRVRLEHLERIALKGDQLSTDMREQLAQFRREDIEMTAFVSRHLREWPQDRIVREWNVYREAAAYNHSWQRARVAREEAAFGLRPKRTDSSTH